MILCAAVKFHFDATDMDVVVPCRRHGYAFQMLAAIGFEPKKGYKELAQGFITTTGQFLTREQAYEHAMSCGQLSATARDSINNGVLFSEDLY